ncbi:MAG: pyruvate dehydrogenase [Phycisphaerae bacterium]|nr:pyruvate dehydrogenase [Phycisphaerae bacterium]
MDWILTERHQARQRRRSPRVGSAIACRDLEAPTTGQPTIQPRPSPAQDPRLIRQVLTIRRTEERLLDLFAAGELCGTVHTCIGQEWVGVAVAHALRPGDALVSNHRGHGHYLAWTDDLEGLIAEVMGRPTGVCGGRGGSQHLCRDEFFSNGIQGGMMPVAAGLALARRKSLSGQIVAAFIGDGTLGEGLVYETLNIAGRWSLPLLIVVEDNGIAQSTPQADTLAGTIAGRAEAFGIPVYQADTWHPEILLKEVSLAADTVRRDGRPALLHVTTYRLRAHSKGDDDRDSVEVARFAAQDPVNQLLAHETPELRDLLSAIDERLDRAVAAAAGATPTAGGTPATAATPVHWRPIHFTPQRVCDAIRDALRESMAADERVILLGEDLRDPYGGAFKITSGLSTRFPDRVLNTPISEAAIVGIGNGLALAGWRPVVEIMFGDFLLIAADQLVNHAAKFAWMYNGQVQVPLIVRTPVGGYRGYGPTHSQCLEKHLLGVPGLRVLAPHRRWCPGQIYRDLLATIDTPTLVIENKLLYGRRTESDPPAGCNLLATPGPFPTVRLVPTEPCQLTLLAYGGMVEPAESAIAHLREAEDLNCDLLIPTQLHPLDLEPIVESVRATGRLLVIEEGQGFAGLGAEVLAQLASEPRLTSWHGERVCARPQPIPAARSAELQALPSVDDIVQAALRLVTGRA